MLPPLGCLVLLPLEVFSDGGGGITGSKDGPIVPGLGIVKFGWGGDIAAIGDVVASIGLEKDSIGEVPS